MDQVYVIRHKVLVEGVSRRRVAREMGVSRNTVRKYLEEAQPVRKRGAPRRRPVYEQVVGRLERLVDEWSGRTTKKQRLTAARLHRALVEEGYGVGLTLVQEWFRERRREAAEVYVPLVHRPGEEAQVDFFDVTVEVSQEWRRAWLFLMRLMYSGRDFAWLYEWADQVSFLDGHVRAFTHLGAVPQRCVYDNLGLAVRRLVLPERELTARFQALASHYLFEPCFTRPASGHDKGGVEARGKGVRLQHLTPIPRGEGLGAISQRLLGELDARARARRDREGRTVMERFEAERSQMLALREPAFRPERMVLCEASRSALVKVGGATYSVPSRCKGLEVTAYLGAERVRLVCRGEEIDHERQRFGGRSVCYRHYLGELARKPQAVRQVAAELITELGSPYGELWRLLVDAHGPREAARLFARVLDAVQRHGEARVGRALRAALVQKRPVLHALGMLFEREASGPIAVPARLAAYQVDSARAADYDHLLDGEKP